ncbi:hypothetical protein CDL12_07511 [Handroanthus impetiginosus]|uniref:Uncharacterized protein n=1 Tax=Handroanthus impetiginosus TaxID=429701 RepID=A0A2G9HQL3_9LAMI|nr:hypothetical protein CDL12_07511 [Handroanthus impetiginosus]
MVQAWNLRLQEMSPHFQEMASCQSMIISKRKERKTEPQIDSPSYQKTMNIPSEKLAYSLNFLRRAHFHHQN